MEILEKFKKLIKEIYKDYKESGNVYRTGCG